MRSFIIRPSWEVRMVCVELSTCISTLSVTTSEIDYLDIIFNSFWWKRLLSFLLDGLLNLVLVLSEFLEIQILSITSPHITALPLDLFVFILVIQVI